MMLSFFKDIIEFHPFMRRCTVSKLPSCYKFERIVLSIS